MSVLLVVPQVVVWTFTLVWLMTERGWSAGVGGPAGHGGPGARRRGPDRRRPVVGRRTGSRLRPIRDHRTRGGRRRWALLALTDWLNSPISVAMVIVASVITVSDNGLAFTAIAEIAGPFWSGRALGTQNTSQLLTAGVAPPLFGGLIGVAGYPVAFAVCALLPLMAIPLVPVELLTVRGYSVRASRGSPHTGQ